MFKGVEITETNAENAIKAFEILINRKDIDHKVLAIHSFNYLSIQLDQRKS